MAWSDGSRGVGAGLLAAAAISCGPRGAATTTRCPEAPQPPIAETNEPLADVDARVERIMKALSVPGLSIAIVDDDEIVHARGYGVLEQGKPAAVDEHTVFAIASNTKAFTATVVGILAAEDALGWDDRVTQHLPDLRTWDEQTTAELRVRDLVSHRAGLPTWAGDLAWIGSPIDVPTLLGKLRHLEGAEPLRSRYGYSNLMFVVAGEVIRAASGRSWAEQVRTRLLEPIGMERTSLSVDALPSQDNVAVPHMPASEEPDAPLIVVPYLDVDVAAPAASLNSSAADMARWLRVQLAGGRLDDREIVPTAVVEDLWEPQTILPVPAAAMRPTQHFLLAGSGWFLYDYDGRRVVTHSGGLPGMTSRVVMVPEEGLGVVVLTNSETAASTFLAYEIVDAVLGTEPVDYVAKVERARAEDEDEDEDEPTKTGPESEPPAEPSVPPKARVGRYDDDVLGRAEVSEVDGVLHLRLPDHGGLDCPLVHLRAEVFECRWSNPIFGTSEVSFEVQGRTTSALRFRVRPQFIDPLEYRFERARRGKR